MPTREPVVVTPAVLRDWPLPGPGADKDERGQVLVVGGTSRTPGAVLLAGESALRVGAGELRMATVDSVCPSLAVAVPEALVVGLPETEEGNLGQSGAEQLVSLGSGAATVLVGPGFADPEATVSLLSAVLPELKCPVVVDALASAYITAHPDGVQHLDGRAVLTMNPKELARTTGADADEVSRDPRGPATELARSTLAVVVCGGQEKAIVSPDGDVWMVQGGGPGLGVSGSGDVQAGILSGLCARGAEPAQAAVWGAYLHARAGERLAASTGALGYLARELPAELPRVLAELA
jgi:ADP-dependent NAD(P)H-hydrate dehydratase